MPIFKVNDGKLKKLSALAIDKERKLQKLVEENLLEVLGCHFLATEYTTSGGRIDTLAVDVNGAPTIIEYKRNKNDNIINQALSYLKWLKTQKPEFFQKLMMDKLGDRQAAAIPFNWRSPRVICIAESFSQFDIDTVEVVPLRIELMRYRYYENDVFALEPVSLAEPPLPISGTIAEAEDKEAAPTVELLLEKASPLIRELFNDLREAVLALDEAIIERAGAYYVAYRISNNFAEVHIGKTQLKIHLRPLDYVDPKNLVEKISEKYNWTMDRRIYLRNEDELDQVMEVIEQSYKNVL